MANALSNTFNTLAGKNGTPAAILGWLALGNAVLVFVPPFNIFLATGNVLGTVAGCVFSNGFAQEHRQKHPTV